MIPRPNSALIDDLHFALDVVEEYSHLGLNDEAAAALRTVMLRQISSAEEALALRTTEIAVYEEPSMVSE
jgi:hypothetical protein